MTREVGGGRELGHVGAGLGDDHVGDEGRDPGDGDDQVPGAAKGLDHHLDSGGDLVDGVAVLVDEVQVNAGQEGVMVAEAAGECFGELRDLGPHPPFRQLGQRGSRWPAMSASSINRLDTPLMSLATDDNLMPASSKSFSRRWISLARPRVIVVRVRWVRSRS